MIYSITWTCLMKNIFPLQRSSNKLPNLPWILTINAPTVNQTNKLSMKDLKRLLTHTLEARRKRECLLYLVHTTPRLRDNHSQSTSHPKWFTPLDTKQILSCLSVLSLDSMSNSFFNFERPINTKFDKYFEKLTNFYFIY